MSTLTSADLHLTRSSTRTAQPPGGRSSISFGDDDAAPDPVRTPPRTPASEVEEPGSAEATPAPAVRTRADVGLVAASAAPAAEVAALEAALASRGVSATLALRGLTAAALPPAAKAMSDSGSVDAVVVCTDAAAAPSMAFFGALPSPVFVLESSAPTDFSALAADILAVKGLREAAPAAGAAAAARGALSPLSPAPSRVEELLGELRANFKPRGAGKLFALGRRLELLGGGGGGRVDLAAFRRGLEGHAPAWSDRETRLLFDAFDADRRGSVSADAFLRAVRGELSEARRALVDGAFAALDGGGAGAVSTRDAVRRFAAEAHPAVAAGERSEAEVFQEFLETFGAAAKESGVLSLGDFRRYYEHVSASVDEDAAFERLLAAAWRLPGAEAAPARALFAAEDCADGAGPPPAAAADGADGADGADAATPAKAAQPAQPAQSRRGRVMQSSVVLG